MGDEFAKRCASVQGWPFLLSGVAPAAGQRLYTSVSAGPRGVNRATAAACRGQTLARWRTAPAMQAAALQRMRSAQHAWRTSRRVHADQAPALESPACGMYNNKPLPATSYEISQEICKMCQAEPMANSVIEAYPPGPNAEPCGGCLSLGGGQLLFPMLAPPGPGAAGMPACPIQ